MTPIDPDAKVAPPADAADSSKDTLVQSPRIWTPDDVAAKEDWGPGLREGLESGARGLAGVAQAISRSRQLVSDWCDPRVNSDPGFRGIARVAAERPQAARRGLLGVIRALIPVRELHPDVAFRRFNAASGAVSANYEKHITDRRYTDDERASSLQDIDRARLALDDLEAALRTRPEHE